MFLEDYRDKIAEILNDEALLIVQLSFQEREVKADAPSQEEKEEPSPFVAKDPLYTLDQMILPEELLAEMQSAINAVKYQKLIYEDWGFVEVDPVPKCVLNFYGPPGTGKTMAAHALAASIGKKIMVATQVANALGLDNVTCVQSRIEDLPGRWDWVVSRAVTSLDNFLPWVFGRYNEGILYLKGGDISAELDACRGRYGSKMPSVKTWKLDSVFDDVYYEEKLVVNLGISQK